MSSVPPPDLLLARRELALERQALALARENAITFFTPHEKQEMFYANASARYRYARTGNRFGKSEMGACEDVAFALGYRPWYPEGHPLRTLGIPAHPTKGLIVCTTWKKSREVFTELESGNLGKLFKYIPKAALGQPTKNHSGFIDRIPVRHRSGEWSVIFLDTIEGFKNNPLAQESSVHDWVHVDEPIPEPMWKAIARGLVDRGGRAWFTCTPLTEPWIDEAFIPDAQADREGAVTFSVGDRWMMKGSMEDNPHNSRKDIDSFMSWLTEDERECRLHGLPSSAAGLVYKEFSYAVHVSVAPPDGWASWDRPPADICHRFAIDYHFAKHNAVLFVATDAQEISYVWAELWRPSLVDEDVENIRNVLCGAVPLPGLVDPLASTPNKINDLTPMDEYRRLGLPVLPATKDPANGIRAVRAHLKARDKRGRATLIFNPACTRTLFEISRGFVMDPDTNKPVKKNDDMMENLYRLCLQGLSYIPPVDDGAYTPIVMRDFSDEILELPTGPSPAARTAERRRLHLAQRYPASRPRPEDKSSWLYKRFAN